VQVSFKHLHCARLNSIRTLRAAGCGVLLLKGLEVSSGHSSLSKGELDFYNSFYILLFLLSFQFQITNFWVAAYFLQRNFAASKTGTSALACFLQPGEFCISVVAVTPLWADTI